MKGTAVWQRGPLTMIGANQWKRLVREDDMQTSVPIDWIEIETCYRNYTSSYSDDQGAMIFEDEHCADLRVAFLGFVLRFNYIWTRGEAVRVIREPLDDDQLPTDSPF